MTHVLADLGDSSPVVAFTPTVARSSPFGARIPPGPRTNYGHPWCYLQSLKDCSPKISREHVLSKVILEKIGQGGQIHGGGLPWLKDGPTSIASFTAKVLSERHNNALSPLDAAAYQAFIRIEEAASHAVKRSLARRPICVLASGEAIERWSLKVLLGFHFAKYARSEGVALLGSHTLDVDTAIAAMMGEGLITPLGLYVDRESRERIETGISVSPLSSTTKVGGVRINMHGLVFDTLVDRSEGNPDFFNNPRFHNPWVIDFDGPERTGRVILTWRSPRDVATRVGLNLSIDRLRAA